MGEKLMYANEFLDAISKAEGDEQMKLLREYGSKPPLSYLLSLNFNSDIKLALPTGMPPYKRDEATNPELFPTLASLIARLKNCMIQSTIPKIKKEQIFIEMLETISPAEADILVSCKDKALHEMYPKITADLVKSAFPAYVK